MLRNGASSRWLGEGPTVAQALESAGGVGPGFNALRLGCAFAVLLSHSFDYTSTVEPFRWFSGTNRSIGGTAVAIFFLTSGFLVAQSYFRSQSIADYVVRRASRIFPAAIAFVLLTALVLGPLVTTATLHRYFGDPLLTSYLWNLLLIGGDSLPDTISRTGIAGTMWTLRYEVICYLLMIAIGAAALLAWRRTFLTLTIVAVVLGWLSVDRQIYVFQPLGIELAYLLRMFAYFAVGMAVYAYRDQIRLDGRAAVVALVVSVVALRINLFHLVFPLMAALLVPYLGLRCNLSLGPIRRNDYSYGVYLWAPIVQLGLIALAPAHASWWFNVLVAAPVTLLLAVASWHVIEKPALAWARRPREPMSAARLEPAS